MRKIVVLLIIMGFVFSCIKEDDYEFECVSSTWPPTPYGTPDDVTTYIDGDYRSIDYIYYCYNGKYINIGYTQVSACKEWEKSVYTSSGICD